MMAGQGLIEDTALELNADIQTQLTAYLALSFISNFSATVSALEADEYDMTLNPYGISSGVINSVRHVFDSTLPGATNIIPTGQGITVDNFDEFLDNHIGNMWTGSNGVFCQRLQVAGGFVEQMNSFVNSAVNGQSLCAGTFQGMDALSTGNISLVNTDTQTFGTELQASGELYNFKNINIVSTPQGLADALVRTNTISNVAEQLEAQGIDAFELQNAIESNDDIDMKPVAQKRLYNAFKNVTGAQLEEILLVMGFETTGITTLADLLDLRKVFPQSYATMQTVIDGDAKLIFINGSISPDTATLESPLEQSYPAAQAKAAKAFSQALQQIKNIHESTPQQLGAGAAAIEMNTGLGAITALASPMPAATTTFYQTQVGGGSGPDGTFFVTDLVGTPAGIPYVENLTTINTNMNTLQTAGAFNDVYQVFDVMSDVAAGTFDLNPGVDGTLDIQPPSLPASGFWPTHDAAINALIAHLNTIVMPALLSAYNSEVTAINDAFTDSYTHILTELDSLKKAQITFLTTLTTTYDDPLAVVPPANTQAILGFASSLPSIGKKTDKGNVAEILEGMATNTQSGQAIIGAMREGRNDKKFNDAGIKASNKIDDSPKTVIPGNIS